MNTFKLQSLKFSFPFIALFWSIALVLIIFIIIPAQKAISAGPIPIEEVDFSGDFDKLYVSLKVNAIYDWYYERTENGKIAGKEYIISPDGYYYMGLYALDEDIPAAEKLLKATTAYLEGDIDDNLLADAQYETHVFIEKIRFFTLEYYNDYVSTLDEDIQARFLPYYLKTYDPEDTLTLCSIIIKVLFIIGLIPLLLILSGIFQKDVRKYIKNSPSPSIAHEKLDNFINSTTETNGLRFNRDFLCGTYDFFTVFIKTSDIARIYTENHMVTHIHGIPIKEKIITIVLKNGITQPIAVRNLETAKKQLKELQTLCPWISIGLFPRRK